MDLPHPHGAHVVHGLEEIVVLEQEVQGTVIEDASGVSEVEALAGALDEPDVELLLQMLDGAGEHRLGDEELSCRLGKALLTNYLYKILQLLDLHTYPSIFSQKCRNSNIASP